MQILTFLVGLLLVIIGIFMYKQHNSLSEYGLLPLLTGVILCLHVVLHKLDEKTPTALDVYRNKTTLQITYKDGIPVDSVVVFKK